MSEKRQAFDTWLGIGLLGCALAGALGFVVAVIGLFNADLVASAAGLIAAAIAFGALVNSLLGA